MSACSIRCRRGFLPSIDIDGTDFTVSRLSASVNPRSKDDEHPQRVDVLPGAERVLCPGLSPLYLQPLVPTSIRAYDGSSVRVGCADDPGSNVLVYGGVLMSVNNSVNTLYTMAVRHRGAALRYHGTIQLHRSSGSGSKRGGSRSPHATPPIIGARVTRTLSVHCKGHHRISAQMT